MQNTCWLPRKADNENGIDFIKTEVIREINGSREVALPNGTREIVPPEGIPNDDFFPAAFFQDKKPEGFNYKGRFLHKRDISEFQNQVAAKALLASVKEEPYMFGDIIKEIIDGVLCGDHMLLGGETGVGKTSSIQQLSVRVGHPTVRVNFNANVTMNDFVGSHGFRNGQTVWNDGILPLAMRNGFWLILDELDFCPPELGSILFPVTERRPTLCLKEHDGEIINAHPNFRLFATGNSFLEDSGDFAGTQQINRALLNRFSGHGRIIHYPRPTYAQERKIIQMRLPNMPETLVKRACNTAMRLRFGDSSTKPLYPHLSPRDMINWCEKMLQYRDAIKAAEITFIPLIREKGTKEAVRNGIRAMFGRRIIIGRSIIPIKGTTLTPAFEETPAMAAMETAKKTPTPQPVDDGKPGRGYAAVTSEKEMKAIHDAYIGNGGTYSSYEAIEKDAKFDLRHSGGNNARKVAVKYQELQKGKK